MKKFQYAIMAIGFLTAGISAYINYSEGVPIIWCLVTMIWITDGFMKQRIIDRLERLVDKLKK
jgi:hypothetical protein